LVTVYQTSRHHIPEYSNIHEEWHLLGLNDVLFREVSKFRRNLSLPSLRSKSKLNKRGQQK
jgi:hypothetical protein